jgi:hypothetical protein
MIPLTSPELTLAAAGDTGKHVWVQPSRTRADPGVAGGRPALLRHHWIAVALFGAVAACLVIWLAVGDAAVLATVLATGRAVRVAALVNMLLAWAAIPIGSFVLLRLQGLALAALSMATALTWQPANAAVLMPYDLLVATVSLAALGLCWRAQWVRARRQPRPAVASRAHTVALSKRSAVFA